jgi:predicted RNase H-like HicB family nuclease
MREYSAVIVKGQVAYVARCPELGVTSQGKTEKNALKNLKEAIELYLEDEDVQRELKNNPVHKATIHKIALSA